MATFKSHVIGACAAGDALQAHATALIEHAKGMTYLAFRNEVATIIGERYGVEPHASQLNKGQLTFAKDSAPYQKLKALAALHPKQPKGVNKREPVVVPAALLRATQRAVIDAGLTKSQFDAFVAQLRESVQFK
jgi:hypothetical protein